MTFRVLRQALVLFAMFTVITGVIYPLALTGAARLLFPWQAHGSLVYRGTQPVGSELIGRQWDDPRHFWGRPSATEPSPYNATASSGSNLGPLNPVLRESIRRNLRRLELADSLNSLPVPVDLVTSSGSGLDPHISVEAALYQVPRVAAARGLSPDSLRSFISLHTEDRTLGFLGEPRVNVLRLNCDLDAGGNPEIQR